MGTEVFQLLQQAVDLAGGGKLRPAKPKSLKLAIQSGFPDELIEFYKDFEPEGWCVQLGSEESDQAERLIHCIAAALEATFYEVPGVALYPLGYVTFGGTGCGDVYCIDTSVTTAEGRHPVTLFAVETIHEDTDASYIRESRLEVASSSEDFIAKFTSGELVDTPHYPLGPKPHKFRRSMAEHVGRRPMKQLR
jgi:hypothetical protein